MSWDGQAKHGLQLLGYNRMEDVSCDEIIKAIPKRERRVAEREKNPSESDASEHAQLTGIELPDLRQLAIEKKCTPGANLASPGNNPVAN